MVKQDICNTGFNSGVSRRLMCRPCVPPSTLLDLDHENQEASHNAANQKGGPQTIPVQELPNGKIHNHNGIHPHDLDKRME